MSSNRAAQIRIIDLASGTVKEPPFLSIAVATSGEQGLLGLAFDPNYASNGHFYVNYIAPGGF